MVSSWLSHWFFSFVFSDWTKTDEDANDLEVWDESWDQADVEDEFTEYLE